LPRPSAVLLALIGIATAVTPVAALRVDVLRSIGGLPPHIAGRFEEPIAFEQSRGGVYYVLDRAGHAVYTIDPDRNNVRKAVDIGPEAGRIIQPLGFDVAEDGSFAVADSPRGRQRVQLFDVSGTLTWGFLVPGAPAAHVTLGPLVLNGMSSLRYAGGSLLLNQPESGTLFTEYSPGGSVRRSIGRLRDTGQEQDRDVHLAMNAGLPLVDPTGGYFYVFLAGRPAFRKYDGDGNLLFERLIQGRELDDVIASQPTSWPRRRVEDREIPFVVPVVRAAAVDGQGQLWISLAVPYTYVFDAQGDKIRTVQFSAAGTVSPTSLSFTPGGHLLVTPGCYEFDPG
jgi:hypothetical protein